MQQIEIRKGLATGVRKTHSMTELLSSVLQTAWKFGTEFIEK